VNAALLLPCVLTVVGCTRGVPAQGAGAEGITADSLRGTVEIVGSDPGTWVVMRTEGGTRTVTLAGEIGPLRSVQGFEVVVWGVAEPPADFRVDRFAVRAVDGQAALDGTLRRAGSGWTLQPASGAAIPLPDVPGAREGARVWVVRAADGRVASHGVIREP
jgi:hypothetical protein